MTQNELRGSTTKLSKIDFSSRQTPPAVTAAVPSRHGNGGWSKPTTDGVRLRRMPQNQPRSRSCGQSSHVSYRLVATCQQAVRDGKNYPFRSPKVSEKLPN